MPKYFLFIPVLLIVLIISGFFYFHKNLIGYFHKNLLGQKINEVFLRINSINQGTQNSNSPIKNTQTNLSFTKPLSKTRDKNYLIGAWYFAGWWSDPPSHYTHAKKDWRQDYQDREPLAGWFDNNQLALDQEIKQAYDGGLDFFAFDWYTDRDSVEYPGSKENINNGLKFFLSSTNKSLMKFALLYVNTNKFGVTAQDEWDKVTDQWVNYFKDPQYLKIDGKPVLMVISVGDMHSEWNGKDGVLNAFGKLRSKAKKAGFPEVYIGGSLIDLGKSSENPKKYAEEGYDFFLGGYASHGNIGIDPEPYDSLFSFAPSFWNQFALNSSLPFVPTVSVGWDRRPVVYKKEGYLTNPSPEKFGQLLKLAKDFDDRNQENLVMIYAWNEIGEGGILMPTKKDGYAYLNEILKIF